ncbi:MAG: hypothetical protein IKR33_05530 [Bacteroidales bacterium]|nr:hypothetical protein [Bacteroidales bacterium]
MAIFPSKRVKVTEGFYVNVSNHYLHSDFGVRDSSEQRYYGRRYISPLTPGTGFIEHESESHAYHDFVRKTVSQSKPTYWRLLTKKEPNYSRELDYARAALATADGERKRELLDCYVNALAVGRNAERMERVVRGVKDKMGHHSNKFMVSVISHYKSKINQLSHDMKAVEFCLEDHYSPEVMEAYYKVVDTFVRVVTCRRIWHMNEKAKNGYAPVFFDLGIFDFIRSKSYLPLMRDSNGLSYYILPDCILRVRSSVDFDVVPLKPMTIVSQELAIEETVDRMSSVLGDAASMIRIPEFNLTFYFNHLRPIVEFVRAMDSLKEVI